MQALFLDLASHQGLLACVTAQGVLSSVAVDHRIDDATLTPLIENTLKNAGWNFENVDRVACVVGPGGFTSLRVAVSATNAFAWARGIPSAGLHLSDVYAARSSQKNFLWLHSTKKSELFVRGFGTLEKEFSEAQLWKLDDLRARVASGTPWAGELISEHQAVLGESGLIAAVLRPVIDVLPSIIEVAPFQKKLLQPWYGRGW